jgi:hypothetical protein
MTMMAQIHSWWCQASWRACGGGLPRKRPLGHFARGHRSLVGARVGTIEMPSLVGGVVVVMVVVVVEGEAAFSLSTSSGVHLWKRRHYIPFLECAQERTLFDLFQSDQLPTVSHSAMSTAESEASRVHASLVRKAMDSGDVSSGRAAGDELEGVGGPFSSPQSGRGALQTSSSERDETLPSLSPPSPSPSPPSPSSPSTTSSSSSPSSSSSSPCFSTSTTPTFPRSSSSSSSPFPAALCAPAHLQRTPAHLREPCGHANGNENAWAAATGVLGVCEADCGSCPENRLPPPPPLMLSSPLMYQGGSGRRSTSSASRHGVAANWSEGESFPPPLRWYRCWCQRCLRPLTPHPTLVAGR